MHNNKRFLYSRTKRSQVKKITSAFDLATFISLVSLALAHVSDHLCAQIYDNWLKYVDNLACHRIAFPRHHPFLAVKGRNVTTALPTLLALGDSEIMEC